MFHKLLVNAACFVLAALSYVWLLVAFPTHRPSTEFSKAFHWIYKKTHGINHDKDEDVREHNGDLRDYFDPIFASLNRGDVDGVKSDPSTGWGLSTELSIRIYKTGATSEAKVVQASMPELNQFLLNEVKQLRFHPLPTESEFLDIIIQFWDKRATWIGIKVPPNGREFGDFIVAIYPKGQAPGGIDFGRFSVVQGH